MKTDKLFYQFFLNQPDMLSEWLPEIPPDCQFDYSAPVVKEQEFRHDGVFTPRHKDLTVPIVFIEAQMQADEGFYGRYFAEIYLHLKQYPTNRPWRGILILKSRRQKLGLESPYQLHFSGVVYRLYLQDLVNQEDLSPNLALLRLMILPKRRVVEAARAVLKQAPNRKVLRHRLDWVEAVLVKKFPQLSPEDILKMFNISVDDFSHTRFYKDVFKLGEERGEKKGEQRGEKRGIHKGRQEGRQEGEADLIIRLLTRRCGSLTPEQKAQILSLAIPDLECLAESLLDFTGLEDLQIWLATQIPPKTKS